MATGDRAEEPNRKNADKALRPIRLKSAGKAKLLYQQEMSESAEPKHIHPRRPLPSVPEAPPQDSEKRQ